jgi:4-amino-4-deoxychorismate lyase
MEENIQLNDIHQNPNGFFETILVEKGQVVNYENHLNRMNKGIIHYKLDNSILPGIEDINRLLFLNLAEHARLKIVVIVEKEIIVVMEVHPYEKTEGPYTLLLDDQSFVLGNPELALLEQGLKPLNYHKYRSKTQMATKLGCWDTLIHTDNNILETGKANIYFNINDQWYTPDNSVVQGTIRAKLIDEKRVIPRSITIGKLIEVRGILVSNALIGLVPVKEIIETDGSILWKSEMVNLDKELRLP